MTATNTARHFRILVLVLTALTCGLMAQSRVYAVCVGINNYALRGVQPLRFAQADASNFARFLYNSSQSDIHTVLGPNATKDRVLRTLATVAAKAGPDDVIVFYFSGHGLDGAICTYDSHSPSTLLTYRDLSNVFKKSRARTKLILADTCHSGSGRIAKRSNSGTNDLKDKNIILFLAARSHEKALESHEARGGLFTRYVLSGFRGHADANRDHAITAHELFEYVSRNVTAASGQRQHPVMWGKFDPDLVLLRY